MLNSRRASLNRAAHALANLKEAQKKHTELTQNIPKLAREYQKLARRAALISNANLKTGPLSRQELTRLRVAAQMAKNMSVASRTMTHWGVPANLRNRVAKTMPYVYYGKS
jgi:hypothetical protein